MIKFTPTGQSKISSLDFNNIPFGQVFTDHLFQVDYKNGEWKNPEISELKPISVHPGNLAWHYGQSIFEGMKAFKNKDGQPVLFRPELHIERLNASARRMSMPDFPKDLFMEAVHSMVDIERAWIPPTKGSALYIRPVMVSMEVALGVRASNEYKMMIMTLPVGPYYPKPVSLKTESKYVRAAMGGVGEAKTAGNYAASLLPAQKAKEAGFDQIMWLDAKEFKYVQEIGTMNIFFVIGDTVVTPITNGTILKGITRMSAIALLKDHGYKVEERLIDIQEVVDAYRAGNLKEAFGAGTAALTSNVHLIQHGDVAMDLSNHKNEVSDFVKNSLNDLRFGDLEDKYGWIVPVESSVAV